MNTNTARGGRTVVPILLVLSLLASCRSVEKADFEAWLAEADGLPKVLEVLRDPDSLMGTRVRVLQALIEGGWVAKEQRHIEEAVAWTPNPGDVAVRTAEGFLGQLDDEVTDLDRNIADGLLMLANVMGPSKAGRFRQEVAQWVFAPLDAGGDKDELAEQVRTRLEPARYWSLGAEGVPYYLQLVKARIEFEQFPIASMVRVVLADEDPLVQRRFLTALLQGNGYAQALQAFGRVISDETIPTALRVRLVGLMAQVGWASQIRSVVKQFPEAAKFASTACRGLLRDLVSSEGEDALAARDALFALLPLLPADEVAGVRSKLSAWAFQNVDTSKGPEETWKQLQTRIRPGQVVFLGDSAIPVVMMMLARRTESPDFTCGTMMSFLHDVGTDAVKEQALDAYVQGLRETLDGLSQGDGHHVAALDAALQSEIPILERMGAADSVVALGMMASSPRLPHPIRRTALEAAFRMLENVALTGSRPAALDAMSVALVQSFLIAPLDDQGNWFRTLLIKLGASLNIPKIAELPYLTANDVPLPAWQSAENVTVPEILAGLTLELWGSAMKEATEALAAAEKERDPFGVALYTPEQIAEWEAAVDGAMFEVLVEWTKSPYQVLKVLGVMGMRYAGTAKSLARLQAMQSDPTELSALMGDGATLGSISAASAKAVAYLRDHQDLSLPIADARLAQRLVAKLGDRASLRDSLLVGPYAGDVVPDAKVRKEYDAAVDHLKNERVALVGVIRTTRRTVETICFEQVKDHPDATQMDLLNEFLKKSANTCKNAVEKTLGEDALALASLDDAFYLRSTALGVARWEHLRTYSRLKTLRAFIKFAVDSDARDGTLKSRLERVATWDLQDATLRPVLDMLTRGALAKAAEEWKSSNGKAGLSEQDVALILGANDPPQNFALGAALASMYQLDGYRKSEGGSDVRVAPYLEGLAILLAPKGVLLGNEDVMRLFASRGGDAWFILREWSHRTEADVVNTWLLDDKERAACKKIIAELRKVISAPIDAAVAAGTFSASVAAEMGDHYPFLDYLLDTLFESTAIQSAMRGE